MKQAVLLSMILPLALGGCSSEAVFSGVDAAKVAALMADDMQPGRPKLIRRSMFAIDYENWLKVDKTWTGKVSATAKCTRASHYSSLKTHRYPEDEKMILAELVERVLRETNGKLAGSSVSGLKNIQPVEVRVDKDSASTTLCGVPRQELLKTLGNGLSDIVWYMGRRPADYKELDNGFEFSMQPLHATDNDSPIMVILTIEHDAPSHVMKAMAWNKDNPEELIDGKQLERLVRQAAIYLLTRHNKLRTTPAKE